MPRDTTDWLEQARAIASLSATIATAIRNKPLSEMSTLFGKVVSELETKLSKYPNNDKKSAHWLARHETYKLPQVSSPIVDMFIRIVYIEKVDAFYLSAPIAN